jgi:hypothetical protein
VADAALQAAQQESKKRKQLQCCTAVMLFAGYQREKNPTGWPHMIPSGEPKCSNGITSKNQNGQCQVSACNTTTHAAVSQRYLLQVLPQHNSCFTF